MRQCSQILKKISECPKRSSLYNKINPQLFDVSLRDGIQSANAENFPTNIKKELFHNILRTYNPKKLEIGSLTTAPSLIPIMGDSIELHNYSRLYLHTYNNHILTEFSNNPDIYILIPSIKQMDNAINNNITNFSFITSVSDRFQQKNVKKNIAETKSEFNLMFFKWFREPSLYKKKLYISCFTECPIIGKIDNDFIIKEVLHYHKNFDFNELCLSDTVGSIQCDDFEYIINTCLHFGLPKSKLSFHFHVSPNSYENLEQILNYCFSIGLNKFDISMLETGGCSVTMDSKKLLPNMNYDIFYTILDKYIDRYITFENIYGKDFDKRLYVKN